MAAGGNWAGNDGPINVAPTLNPISNPPPILENSGPLVINLSGITAGGGQSQNLAVTDTSSNPALIPNPTISYTSPNATGTLVYTPVANASGTAVITVTVMDNGGTANGGVNSVSQSFTVTVSPVNQAPTLGAINDPAPILENTTTLQTINLTGISAGPGDAGQNLTITATSSNPALIPNAVILASATAILSGGTVGSIIVTSGGAGYLNPPVVTLTGGGGTGATATAVLNNGVVIGMNVTGGSGYTSAPTVSIASPSTGSLSVGYTSPNTAGTLTYTPAANAIGTATITVTVTDNGGTANGGVNTFTRPSRSSSLRSTRPPRSRRSRIRPGSREHDHAADDLSERDHRRAGQNQNLTITAVSNNPALIPNPTVIYTSPNTSGG